jgi:hypothetical protein
MATAASAAVPSDSESKSNEGEKNDKKKETQPPAQLHIVAETIAKAVLGFLGIAYLCGFLVLYVFFYRFGVHDSNSELLRVRYIHTGLLCLAFPLFIQVPVFAHVWMQIRQPSLRKCFGRRFGWLNLRWVFVSRRSRLRRIVRGLPRRTQFGRSRASFTLELLFIGICLYALVIFEPLGTIREIPWNVWALRHVERLGYVIILLTVVLTPSTLARKYVGFAAAREYPWVRGLIVVVSGALLFLSLYGHWRELGNIAKSGWSYFAFTLLLIFPLVSFVSKPVPSSFPGQGTAALIARSALIMTVALLSTFAFAYRLFPLVPSDKGGGSYSSARDALVCFVTRQPLPVPLRADPSDAAACSAAVKVIDSSETVLYVARADDPGLDSNGKPPKEDKEDKRTAPQIWTEGRYLPTVYALNKGKVASVELKPRTEK